MYTLRCTQRLLKRLRADVTPSVHPPTTALGDWYANVLYVGRAQLVLCVSERSLLSVLVQAKAPRELPLRVRDAVESILHRLRIPEPAIQREVAAMSDVLVGRTLNRSVLGSMNEIAFHCRYRSGEPRVPADLEAIALEMSEMPMLSMAVAFPSEAAAQLLGAA
jgi:hypothetical protein